MKTILLILYLFAFNSFSQDIVKRQTNSTAEEFVQNELSDYDVQEVFEGKWGNSNKILATFYNEVEDEKQALLFEEISPNNYQIREFPYYFGVGVYPNTSYIDTVIYEDVNNDGSIDMTVIENGTYRCRIGLEEEDPETGETIIIQTSASCDVCACTVFSVLNDEIEVIAGDEDPDWNCDKPLIIQAMREEAKKAQK